METIFSSLIFWKHSAVYEFHGANDISFQTKGPSFPSSVRSGLAEVVTHVTGTYKLTSTRHVTLKSPLLLQFRYCDLCDNDNKQLNYRLMNVLCRSKASLFANFSKSPKK